MHDEIEAAAKREADMELVRREMQRRSRDIIRIFNPTDTTFRFTWDSYPIIVPAHGTKDVERYIAEVYLRRMSQKLIGEQIMKEGEELKALREKQLGAAYRDKWIENKEVWDMVPKLDDQRLISQHAQILIQGLVEEYGMEDLPVEVEKQVEKQETPYDQAYRRMDRKILEDNE